MKEEREEEALEVQMEEEHPMAEGVGEGSCVLEKQTVPTIRGRRRSSRRRTLCCVWFLSFR